MRIPILSAIGVAPTTFVTVIRIESHDKATSVFTSSAINLVEYVSSK